MPNSEEILSPEEFLERSMAITTKIEFTEFLDLWNSSECSKLLIKQFVSLQGSKQIDQKAVSDPQIDFPLQKKDKFRQSEFVDSLITKEHISASQVSEKGEQSFGGINRKRLLILLDQYKSGNRDLAAYLLARAWKKNVYKKNPPDFRLRKMTLDTIERSILQNETNFLKELARAIEFLGSEEYEVKGNWDHDPSQWWQFHLLLYIFENPKPMYPIREFVRHFREEIGENEMPTSKTLRHFCRKHGIALDSTPGAPKQMQTNLTKAPS